MSNLHLRSPITGSIDNLPLKFAKETSLDVFRKICLCRAFELKVKESFDNKLIKCPIYLSLGQESIASALSQSYKNPSIFAQHRAHDLYLSYGGDMGSLIDELLHKDTGCAGGMGGSASIHSPAIGMFGHSGLMGDQVPIAVGYAIASGKRTLAVMGDASGEEDYVLGSMGYAAHKKAPILFVCVDNGLSILTKVNVRRNWKLADVAKSFGLNSVDITDDPWLIMHHVDYLKNRLPAFMNIHTVRHLWHAGTGKDNEPEWHRFEMIKKELEKMNLKNEVDSIETEMKKIVEIKWRERLNLI